MGPGIRAIECDIERKIADDLHLIFVGVGAQLLPLAVKDKLLEQDKDKMPLFLLWASFSTLAVSVICRV